MAIFNYETLFSRKPTKTSKNSLVVSDLFKFMKLFTQHDVKVLTRCNFLRKEEKKFEYSILINLT